MKQMWRIFTVAVALCAVGSGSRIQAQFGGYNSPVSPYMNLLYPGASPGVNYFNLVQPQIQFNEAIGSLQSQQNVMGRAIASNTLGQATGHPVMFGNYSHYYPMRRGGMGGRGGMGMGGGGMGMGGGGMGMGGMGMGMGGMGMGGMGMGGMGMGGMGMGGMGMGGMGMGGMGMGGMGMGGMGMGGMGMGGMGMGGMGMGR